MTGRSEIPPSARPFLVSGVDGPEGRTPREVAFLVVDGARTSLAMLKANSGRERAAALALHEGWVASLEVLAALYRQDLARPTCDADIGHLPPNDVEVADAAVVSGITVREAADRLGLEPRSVGRLRQQGLVEGRQVGREWLIDPASVERLRQQRGAV